MTDLYVNRDPINYVVPVPDWLKTIISDDLNYKITYLNMKHSLPEEADIIEVEQSLVAALLSMRRLQDPASTDEIDQSLQAIARVFRAQVPDGMGYQIYLQSLQSVPSISFKEACRKICREHKWPNMPLIAEFMTAAAPVTDRLETWVKRFTTAENNLKRLKKLD